MQLGKLPATVDHRDLLFASYREPAATLPLAPVGYGHQGLVPSFGMLGNDRYGDCVLAGAGHETMLWNAVAGRKVAFDDHHTLGDYSAVTGFNPADPSTDRGTDVHNALAYRRKTGVADAAGHRHKIGAYVALEAGNWAELLEALEVFEAVGIGFEFPTYAMDQFNAGKPWTYRAGATIDGGHYVPVVGRPGVSMLSVVTWGAVQHMSRAFFQHFCDEAWAIMSPEMLNAQGLSAEGFNVSQLQADVAAL